MQSLLALSETHTQDHIKELSRSRNCQDQGTPMQRSISKHLNRHWETDCIMPYLPSQVRQTLKITKKKKLAVSHHWPQRTHCYYYIVYILHILTFIESRYPVVEILDTITSADIVKLWLSWSHHRWILVVLDRELRPYSVVFEIGRLLIIQV